ncbi:MAG: AMP-binding protein [Kiloniellales bacterium]
MAQLVTPRDFLSHLRARGDTPALLAVSGEHLQRISSSDLAEQAERLAAGLLREGLGAGEPVGLYAPNSIPWVVARFGIAASGGLAVALDDLLPPAEAAALVRHSGCRLLFTVKAHVEGLREALTDDAVELRMLDDEEDSDAGQSWRGLLDEPPARLPEVAADSPAMVVYTSGTTGRPKSFILTYANIGANVNALASAGLVGTQDRIVLPLPLDNVYPYVVGLLTSLTAGASVVLPEEISAAGLARALSLSKATVMIGVPRLYAALVVGIRSQAAARGRLTLWIFDRLLALSIAMLRRGRPRLGKRLFRSLHARLGPDLRLMVSGGARLEPSLIWSLEGLGWDVRGGYGLAEVGSVFTGNTPGQKKIGSEGKPVNAGEVRIAEVDDESLSGAGENGIGEIQLRGPSVFAGYRDNPEANRAAFTEDGWFRTGDLGRLDAEGYLYVTGRVKEMIVLGGGKNVFPEVLEKTYSASPYIKEIAVLEQQGALVGLVLPDLAGVQASGYARVEDALRVSLSELGRELPRFQRLSGIAIAREPLPRTRLGKYRRFLLPEIYQAARRGEAPAKAAPLSEADRAFLAEPPADSVWALLRARYADRPLSLDANLQLDLGIDSLEAMSLAAEIESRLGRSLPDEKLAAVQTVRELIQAAAEAPQASAQQPAAKVEEQAARWLTPTGPFLSALGIALHALNWLLMRLLFRLNSRGREHLPPAGPCLLVANHASDLDPPALAAALPPPLRRQLYWGGDTVRLFSGALSSVLGRALHVFPVDEKAPAASLALASQVLQSGQVLAWFPESWRSPDGRLQRFFPGVGQLAGDCAGPVIPVYIEGSFEAMPRWRRLPRLHPLRVHFGAAVAPERLAQAEADGGAAAVAALLRQALARLSPLEEDTPETK